MRFGGVALLFVAAVLASSPSKAEEPARPFFPASKGSWVSVGGGVRAILQGDQAKVLRSQGIALTRHDWLEPAVLASASYQFDPAWAVRAEFGWSPDRYALGDGSTISVHTILAHVVVEWIPPLNWGRVQPYLGGGLGYYFSSVNTTTDGVEQSTTVSNSGVSAVLGVRFAITPGLGLVLEERYAFAFSPLGSLGGASVGGNTVALGLFFGWK